MMAARAASTFTLTSPEVDALEAVWEIYGDQYDRYAPLTKRDICKLLDLPTTMAACAAVSEWMTQQFGHPRKHQGRKNTWLFPVPKGQELRMGALSFADKAEGMRTFLSRAGRGAG